MKRKRALILIGGALNALAALFHVALSWQIHHLTGVEPGTKALTEMLGIFSLWTIAFFAVASLFCPTELLTTRLGRLVTLLIALTYLTRTAEEVLLAPHFSPFIFANSLLVGLIYAAALLPGAAPRRRAEGSAA